MSRRRAKLKTWKNNPKPEIKVKNCSKTISMDTDTNTTYIKQQNHQGFSPKTLFYLMSRNRGGKKSKKITNTPNKFVLKHFNGHRH